MKTVHKRKILEIADTNLSPFTKQTYEHNLKMFFEFSGIKKTAELIHLPNDQLQDILIEYAQYVANLARAGTISNNTVSKRFRGIKYLLDVNYRENDVKWRPIRALFPERVRLTGFKPYTTEHISEMIRHEDSHRNLAFIHFMASIGARIGIHGHPLLMKHLVPMSYQREDDCFAVLLYADKDLTPGEKDQTTALGQNDDYSYYGFLTPEATKFLKDYFRQRENRGEIIDGDSPIFRTFYTGKYNFSKKAIQMTRAGAISLMVRIIKDSGIERIKSGNRYDIQMDHGFRKRFNTVLKLESDVNTNIAEKLMAHKRGLDGTYLTPTRDECFKEFSKAITQLTIDPAQRNKLLILQQESEISELKKAQLKIDTLTRKQDQMNEVLESLGQINSDLPFTITKDSSGKLKALSVDMEMIRAGGPRDLAEKIKKARELE